METNKIGKYTIKEDDSAQNRITNLVTEFENNQLSIKWDFPKNPHYKLVVIFETEDSSLSLQDLLQSSCERTTLVKGIQTEFTQRLKADAAFKLYPATFGEGDEIDIIAQKSGNETPLFSKLIKVTYSISYSRIHLTNLKSAKISISASEPLAKGALYYKKLRGNQEIAKYPLDPALIKSEKVSPLITIRADEQIKIYQKPGSGNIELAEVPKLKY